MLPHQKLHISGYLKLVNDQVPHGGNECSRIPRMDGIVKAVKGIEFLHCLFSAWLTDW